MRLLDCFLEPIAFAVRLTDPGRTHDIALDSATSDFDRMIERLDGLRRRGRFSDRLFDDARFAVLVWIDETILTSHWQGAADWSPHSLQRRYYGTYRGGEEFYARLTNVLNAVEEPDLTLAGTVARAPVGDLDGTAASGAVAEREEHQLLEVFAACLSLGFKGQYHGEDQRETLQATLTRTLLACRNGRETPATLVLDDAPPPPQRSRGGLWTRGIFAMQATSVAVLLLIYFFYRYDLTLMLAG